MSISVNLSPFSQTIKHRLIQWVPDSSHCVGGASLLLSGIQQHHQLCWDRQGQCNRRAGEGPGVSEGRTQRGEQALLSNRTRGHRQKLMHRKLHLNLRKNFFVVQ